MVTTRRSILTFITLILVTLLAGAGLCSAQSVGDTITVGADEPAAIACIDGDTCRMGSIDRDLRLARIDAPELNGPCPVRAKLAAQELSKMVDYRPLNIIIVDTGHYDRYIVEMNVGNINLSEWMLHRNLVTRWPVREPSTLCDNAKTQ